jgi:DNA adenine methylase
MRVESTESRIFFADSRSVVTAPVSPLRHAAVSPILRWAGSKKKLLPTLINALPAHIQTYREPFVGSGVLFLNVSAQGYVLSDINPHLVEAYEIIRQYPRAIWRMLSDLPTDTLFYYNVRSIPPETLNKMERAARFVYLNRFCFNGVYRTNRQGYFNVSRGEGDLFIPTQDAFSSFANKLKLAEVTVADFEEVVDGAGLDDFVYLDPPYAEENKRDRGEYGPNAFKVHDLERLVASMKRANRRGARILLSYSARFLDLRALQGWAVRDLSVMRNVAGFASDRRVAQEILVSNYKW